MPGGFASVAEARPPGAPAPSSPAPGAPDLVAPSPGAPEPFFTVLATQPGCRARRGLLRTAHGDVETPTFMPVGTYGAVRLLGFDDVRASGARIVLGNALHLASTAGAERVRRLGGLAAFTGWGGPTLTDSGGYQVSYMWRSGTHAADAGRAGGDGREGAARALAEGSPMRGVNRKGALYRNPWTGQETRVTPQLAMEWQAAIGADIVMAFDRPTFDTDAHEAARESVRLSHEWTLASRARWLELRAEGLAPAWQRFFPIVQGGRFEDLRAESCELMASLGADGVAVAGESVGMDPDVSAETLAFAARRLPPDKPLYGMGLGGGPEGYLKAVREGLDMFDNTSATRLGRCGLAYISPAAGGTPKNKFRASIKKGACRDDGAPVDASCGCPTCRRHTRAYIKHLFSIGEASGARLLTIHNLHFMEALGAAIRDAISRGAFDALCRAWLG
jgi:queuine tRNA-ribosyltransferase